MERPEGKEIKRKMMGNDEILHFFLKHSIDLNINVCFGKEKGKKAVGGRQGRECVFLCLLHIKQKGNYLWGGRTPAEGGGETGGGFRGWGGTMHNDVCVDRHHNEISYFVC